MKVLYDAQSRVVRVKYSGRATSDELANLKRALEAEYGTPHVSGAATQWQLPGSFVLALEPEGFGWELSYVNTTLDAELRRAVEEQERRKVEELKQRRGTAF
jgi:hypothetical protein